MTTTSTPATEPRSSQPSPVTDPAQLHAAFMAATNTHDVGAMLALYDSDALAVQLDGSTCRGPAALREMVEGLTAAITRIDGATRKVFVVGDVALSSGTWTAEVVLPDGTVVEQRGTTAEVCRRQHDGTWKIVIDDPMFV